MQGCCGCRVRLRKQQWEGDSGQAAEEHRVEEVLPKSDYCMHSALAVSVAAPAVWAFWLVLL